MFSLETVKVKTPFCNNDAAVITFNDNESNIDGKIIRPQQNSISILFNPFTPSIGLLLGNYTIIYEKHITDYGIRVTLTFHELVDQWNYTSVWSCLWTFNTKSYYHLNNYVLLCLVVFLSTKI